MSLFDKKKLDKAKKGKKFIKAKKAKPLNDIESEIFDMVVPQSAEDIALTVVGGPITKAIGKGAKALYKKFKKKEK